MQKCLHLLTFENTRNRRQSLTGYGLQAGFPRGGVNRPFGAFQMGRPGGAEFQLPRLMKRAERRSAPPSSGGVTQEPCSLPWPSSVQTSRAPKVIASPRLTAGFQPVPNFFGDIGHKFIVHGFQAASEALGIAPIRLALEGHFFTIVEFLGDVFRRREMGVFGGSADHLLPQSSAIADIGGAVAKLNCR